MTDSGRYQLLFRLFCELTSGLISDKLLQSVSIALLAYQTKPRGSHRKDLNESDIIPNPVGRKTFSREITYILYNHQSRVISLESPKRCALCKLLFHAYNHFLLIYVVDACSFLTLASWKHPVSFSELPICHRSHRTCCPIILNPLNTQIPNVASSEKCISPIYRIWDDTLWRNYFLQLLLRSIILDNSVNPNNIDTLSKIAAGVNLQKKLSPKSVSFQIRGIDAYHFSVQRNNIRYRHFSSNLILLGQLVLQKIDHILQFRTLDRCNSMIHLLPV